MAESVWALALVKSCYTTISHDHCLMVGVNMGSNRITSLVFNMIRVVRPRDGSIISPSDVFICNTD